MRRTTFVLGLLAAAALAAGAAVLAQDRDGGPAPEDEKAAKAAEDEALKLGDKVFHDKAMGTSDRACATCHDSPKKPELNLRGITAKFPRWDRQAGRVITLQEKFVQMQQRSLKASETLPLGDARWTALEMHLRGLR